MTMKWDSNRIIANVYLYILLAFLYSPIAIIIIYSFTESKVLGNWSGFSFGLYDNLFSGRAQGADAMYSALVNTVIIAFSAAIVSTLMGTVAAIGIHNMRGVQRRAVNFMNDVPMINPDIITGISIFLLFVFLGISRGMFTVICSHIAFCTPYVVLSVMPRLTKMNPNIYEAALDLGATPMQAFRKVMLPELWPGMVSGFILSLTLSIDDFAVTFFTKGSDGLETLSTYIYSDARKGGLTPELRPLSALIFIAMLLLLIVINVRASRQKKELKKKGGRKMRQHPSRNIEGLRRLRSLNNIIGYIIAFFFVLTLNSSLCITSANAVERSEILKVYNWADYIDEDLIMEFEKWYYAQTGKYIHIVYQTFDINESMLTEIEVGHEDYDVVCPSEYIIERMLRKNLLLPINKQLLEQTHTPLWFDNVSEFATDKFQQMAPKGSKINVADYAVGYMWGTTGFLYNKKYLKAKDLDSWGALYDPRYLGKILVKDAFRDVYSCLVCFARYDDILAGKVTRDVLVANITDENIQLVENMLRRAKPNIFGWEVDFGKETMTKGKAWANLSWSGDAEWAIEEAHEVGVDLDYVVPKEGSNVWFDGWVIPKYAKNPNAAAYFIDFMCKSENAVRNMDAIGYVSVIGTAEVLAGMKQDEKSGFPYVDASYMFGPAAKHVRLNPVMYPDMSVINRCALMHDCADKTEAMVEMWSRVKGDSLNVRMILIICTVIGVLVFIYVSSKVRKYRRKRRRRRRLAKMK